MNAVHKARIVKVGTCYQREDGCYVIEGWYFDGEGLPVSFATGCDGSMRWMGWTFEELAALSAAQKEQG